LQKWEAGPMRQVVEEVAAGMTVVRDPYPITHHQYRLSCGHTVLFPMPERKAVACKACGEAIREQQEREAQE
jgi:hypothetical protein